MAYEWKDWPSVREVTLMDMSKMICANTQQNKSHVLSRWLHHIVVA